MARRSKLAGPWSQIHGAIWLIGLAILLWRGWLWPGILVLVAISAIVEAVILMAVPSAAAPEPAPAEPAPAAPQPEAAAPAAEPEPHRADLLPSECPKCNAPIRAAEVRWTGPRSADCPYCGANLPTRPPQKDAS